MVSIQQVKTRLKAMAFHPRSVAALCVVCAVGMCALTGHMLWELRRQAWQSSIQGADNLLAALSQDIARNIELYDLSLLAVVDGLKLPNLESLSPEMRQAVLFDRAATAKYLGSILIMDEHGNIVGDAGSVPPRIGNLMDREYFTVHRDNPGRGLFISKPFRRRITGPGDLVIAFSRRIDKADGSFGGIVLSTLRLDYFQALFEHFHFGEHGVVGLSRSDGTVLARAPYDEGKIGRTLAPESVRRLMAVDHGRFIGESGLDGIWRVVNHMRIDPLPLVLSVNVSEADIFAAWNSRAIVIAAVLAAMCLAMGGLGILFSGELRRRFRAEAEMRRSEQQLRLLADHATDVIVRLDSAMTRRYVSSSSRSVLGYEPRDLVGFPARRTIHPEDWPNVFAKAEEARRVQGHSTVDYRILRSDGSYVWVEGKYGYMAVDDGFTVVLRDISARKAAEHELSEAHAKLTRIAITDALTGLANRRRFDEAITQEWRRAAREELPLTLLLLDVDRFKQFNDRYGHQEGDACLHAIAQAVAGCARRPADLVARYGGEEIAILLPGTDDEYAAVVAERVRVAVANLALPHADNEPHGSIVTSSLGTATVIPSMRQPVQTEAEIKAFILAADQALYAAKRMGRNRVATQTVEPIRLAASAPEPVES